MYYDWLRREDSYQSSRATGSTSIFMETNTLNPVFICGHPKAGTSLITALLDGHPAVVVYPEETLFFRRFLPAIQDKPFDDQLALAQKFLIHIFEWNQDNPPTHQKDFPDRDYADIPFEAILEELSSFLAELYSRPGDFLEGAVTAFGCVTGLMSGESRYWVEKSPYNEFFTEQIFEWWPGACCIHIIRDPRDNFVSYQRKHPDWTAKQFAGNWVHSTQAGFDNQEKFGKERYHIIRFEDLVSEPRESMSAVAGFLNLPWDDALLRPTRVGDSWRGNSMFADRYQQVSTAPVGRWKEHILPFDLAILQAVCKPVMVQAGYALANVKLENLTFTQRTKLLKEGVLNQIKQRFFK